MRVLVVDDHEVVLWGVRLVLSRVDGIERCLQAADGAQAIEMARRYAPHVAIVDLMMEGESGLDVAARLRHEVPGLRTLLTSGIGELSRPRALAAGVAGFVPKAAGADELIRAVQAVGAGGTWFGARPAPRQARELSAHEHEVLRLIAGGATNREIAARLHLSPHTVKQQATRVYRKLAARNRAEAVARAQQAGLVA